MQRRLQARGTGCLHGRTGSCCSPSCAFIFVTDGLRTLSLMHLLRSLSRWSLPTAVPCRSHGALQYIGLFFYLQLVRCHTARVAVSWATVRKAVTVGLSLIASASAAHAQHGTGYSHGAYLGGTLLVFGGICVEKRLVSLGFWCDEPAAYKKAESTPHRSLRL